jgi:hypothetical protein
VTHEAADSSRNLDAEPRSVYCVLGDPLTFELVCYTLLLAVCDRKADAGVRLAAPGQEEMVRAMTQRVILRQPVWACGVGMGPLGQLARLASVQQAASTDGT